MPRKLFRSVSFFGGFIFTIASILLSSTFKPSGVSLCPKNLQLFDLNCSFLAFNFNPLALAVSHNVMKLASCSISNALSVVLLLYPHLSSCWKILH